MRVLRMKIDRDMHAVHGLMMDELNAERGVLILSLWLFSIVSLLRMQYVKLQFFSFVHDQNGSMECYQLLAYSLRQREIGGMDSFTVVLYSAIVSDGAKIIPC